MHPLHVIPAKQLAIKLLAWSIGIKQQRSWAVCTWDVYSRNGQGHMWVQRAGEKICAPFYSSLFFPRDSLIGGRGKRNEEEEYERHPGWYRLEESISGNRGTGGTTGKSGWLIYGLLTTRPELNLNNLPDQSQLSRVGLKYRYEATANLSCLYVGRLCSKWSRPQASRESGKKLCAPFYSSLFFPIDSLIGGRGKRNEEEEYERHPGWYRLGESISGNRGTGGTTGKSGWLIHGLLTTRPELNLNNLPDQSQLSRVGLRTLLWDKTQPGQFYLMVKNTIDTLMQRTRSNLWLFYQTFPVLHLLEFFNDAGFFLSKNNVDWERDGFTWASLLTRLSSCNSCGLICRGVQIPAY